MQKVILISLGLLFGCTNQTKSPEAAELEVRYPLELQKIFSKHGSLSLWEKMNSLSYEIVEEEANEKQMVHLKDRRERIEGADFVTGFDGINIWIEADTSYQGDPVFYHNLMFYFYAMPFVLADDGINYSSAEALTFEEKSYPGIRITYDVGVGMSAQDEYFIHYDPETYQMAWLGYTVTYFSKEKSNEIRWIRYNDWKTYEGLVLPKSMTWYRSEEGKIIDPKGSAEFEQVMISEYTFDDAIFQKTAGARIMN